MADIIEYLRNKDIEFEPSSIFEDVMKAKDFVHGSRLLHDTIMNDLPTYLNRYYLFFLISQEFFHIFQ